MIITNSEPRQFCVAILVRGFYLFENVRDDIVKIYSETTLPVREELITICRLDNTLYKGVEYEEPNILYIDNYNPKCTNYKHLSNICKRIEDVCVQLLQAKKYYKYCEDHKEMNPNIYRWYKYTKGRENLPQLNKEIIDKYINIVTMKSQEENRIILVLCNR